MEKFRIEVDAEDEKKLSEEEKEKLRLAREKQKEMEKNQDSFIIDLRTSTEKKRMRECKKIRTFSEGKWHERPEMML